MIVIFLYPEPGFPFSLKKGTRLSILALMIHLQSPNLSAKKHGYGEKDHQEFQEIFSEFFLFVMQAGMVMYFHFFQLTGG